MRIGRLAMALGLVLVCLLGFDGTVLEYTKGSGVVRYLIGFGAGKAAVTMELKLVSVSTGQVLFSGNFRQQVGSWTESGDECWERIAKEFAKELEKQNNKLGGRS